MIRKKQPTRAIVVDLTGPAGNAFSLLGNAQVWAKQIGIEWDPILEEATSGDYENLVETLDRYFGDFVIFER